METAIEMRTDYSAVELRLLAKSSRTARDQDKSSSKSCAKVERTVNVMPLVDTL